MKYLILIQVYLALYVANSAHSLFVTTLQKYIFKRSNSTECTRPWLDNVPLTQLAGASLSSWGEGSCVYPARILAPRVYAHRHLFTGGIYRHVYANVLKRPRIRCIRVRAHVCVDVSEYECDRRIVSARPTYLFTVPASTTSMPSSRTACLACLTDLLLFIFLFSLILLHLKETSEFPKILFLSF